MKVIAAIIIGCLLIGLTGLIVYCIQFEKNMGIYPEKSSKQYTRGGKIFSVIIALILAVTAVYVLSSCSGQENTASEPYSDEELYGDDTLGISPEADKSLKDFRTYLITGIDDGKRSDIMLILTVNEETGKAAMTSVDRDAYMQVKDGEPVTVDGNEYVFFKCNRSYKNGGIYCILKELNSHMDLNMRDCIAINWEGVATLIDRLGGIDVDVEEEMLYWINNDAQPKGSGKAKYTIDHAGPQTLSGWQAVQYLRVRKYEGGNARVRAKRNEEIIHQLLDKAAGLSDEEKSEIYLEMSDSIDSNMNYETLAALIEAVSSADVETTDVWPYESVEKWDKDWNFYYHVPVTLESNVTELHKVLFGQEGYKPSEQCRKLSEKIDELSESQLVEDAR